MDTAVTSAAPGSTRRATHRAAAKRSSSATSVPCRVTTYGRRASHALMPPGAHQCACTRSMCPSLQIRAIARAWRTTSDVAADSPHGVLAAATILPRYASVSQRAGA